MADDAVFHKERHIKYFLRCLKTFLPDLYTPNDSNRMLLAFFTVAGLDILGALQSKTTPEEREGYIEWVYHCQVPTGGFRGFSGTDFGLERRTPENGIWDPANVPSTFFAIVILLILGDDLSRVKRRECLQWLPQVQRADGSFGEVLGAGGKIEGGRDLRFCCCAAGTRYLLRGKDRNADLEGVKDVNVDRLVAFIGDCQSHDGGMSESPLCESHSGLTYAGIGALTFLNRLSENTRPGKLLSSGSSEFESLARWIVSRQTPELGEESEEEGDNDKSTQDAQGAEETSLEDKIRKLPNIEPSEEAAIRWAGFNGRCNKIADTCYSFWNSGTLAMMDRLSLVDVDRNRRYLLEKTQHIIGGFGKGVGEPPDLLHSYFGMVALALQGEPGLDSVDPALCASVRAAQHLKTLPWWQDDSSGLDG